MKKSELYLGIAIIIAFVLVLTVAMTSARINELDCDIEGYKEDIKEYKEEIDEKDGEITSLEDDLENYECPEPDPIYINKTEYIYEDIYLYNTHCDVTGDGIVNYEDVCDVLHYINHGLSKVEQLFYCKYQNAWDILYDVNRDGTVNEDDVSLIMEYSDLVW